MHGRKCLHKFSHIIFYHKLIPESMLLQGSDMWRKSGEKGEKKFEEEGWEEPSTAPIGLLELVIHLEKKILNFICIPLQFKFASNLDYFLVVFGVVLALCGGAGGPILMVMFGVIIQVISSLNLDSSILI